MATAHEPAPAEIRRQRRIAAVMATILSGIGGGGPTVVMPVILFAFASARHLTVAETAQLGSAELAGIGLLLVFASGIGMRLRRSLLICAGAGLAAAGNIASIMAPSFDTLLISRVLAGCGEGVLLAAMTATVSGLTSPDKVFGLFFATQLLLCTVFLSAASALVAAGGVNAMLTVLIIFAGAITLLSPLVDLLGREPGRESRDGSALPRPGMVLLLTGLAAPLLLYAAIGIVWPSITTIASASDVPAAIISRALTVATAAGIVAGLIVSWCGTRFGRIAPIAGGSGLLALLTASLLFHHQAWAFGLIVVTYMFVWIFVTPYYMGLLAAVDPSGRLAVVSVAMQPAGLAIGQSLCAALVADLRYAVALKCGVALVVIAAGIATTISYRRQAV